MNQPVIKCPFCDQSIRGDSVPEGCHIRCPGCKAVFDPSDQLKGLDSTGTDQLVGCQLGNYQVIRVIGEGGMGTVYEAVQGGLERRVALKVLSRKLVDDKAFVRRFHHEAKSTAKVEHPNIIQVYEIGQDKGRMFFSMQYVDGESLLTKIQRDGPMPLEPAVKILLQVIDALEHAYRYGIIHRDIKPDNILISTDGTVKVADLGLAKSLWEPVNLTNTGAGVGSPHYMAPEQGRGEKDLDCRADIYSLGITFFVMLTARQPFSGNSALDILMAHIKNPLPSVCRMRPDIPPAVDAILQRMCAKTPEGRSSDYAEVREALLAMLASHGKPRLLRAITVNLGRGAGLARRRPVLVGALLGTVMAICFVLFLWGLRKSGRISSPGPFNRARTAAVQKEKQESRAATTRVAKSKFASARSRPAEGRKKTRPRPVLTSDGKARVPVDEDIVILAPAEESDDRARFSNASTGTRKSASNNVIRVGAPKVKTSAQTLSLNGRVYRFGRPLPLAGTVQFDLRYSRKALGKRYRLLALEKWSGFLLDIERDGKLLVKRRMPGERVHTIIGGKPIPGFPDNKWHRVCITFGSGTETVSVDNKAYSLIKAPMLSAGRYGSLLFNPEGMKGEVAIRGFHISSWFDAAKEEMDGLIAARQFRKALDRCRWILEFAADVKVRSFAHSTLQDRVIREVIEEDLNPTIGARRRKLFAKKYPEMVEVPATRPGKGETGSLPTFYIDRCEVSIAEYARFVAYVLESGDHSKCHPAEPPNKDHRPYGLRLDAKKGAFPVHGIDWFDAYAYAAWAGKRLPFTIEWQKAAAGKQGLPFLKGRGFDLSGTKPPAGPAPVLDSSRGRSPYGCLNLLGNVDEWCADAVIKAGTSWRTLCGGSWLSPGGYRNPFTVKYRPARERDISYGFRCVKDPE